MNMALQYHTYRRELTQRASDGKGTKSEEIRTVIVKKPHFISQISHKLVFTEYIIAKEKRRITQIFFLVLRSSDYQFSIYPQSQFVKTPKRGNWNLITIYSRERVLSKFSTYSKFVCKNILADSASLLRILSKSILRPVLRKILTIFLNA